MRFLIAGLGSIGRRHLRNLMALGERDFVLYRTHQSTLPDKDLQDFPVETNLQAALDRQPQAVIIATPTALYLQVAQPAAERGIHIFLEKPVSHSLEGVQKFQETVARQQVRVLVGFQFRFHPGIQRIKVLLDQGAVGRPLAVRAHWGEYLPGWHPWEDYRQGYSARLELGGGVILTLCHPLDYLRSLLGEVNALWAFSAADSDLGIPVEDRAEIGLHFQSGVIGSVHLDYVQQPPAHHLEIIGSTGTIKWDYASGAVSLFQADSDGWQHFPAPPEFERNHMFLEQMRHFRAVLRDDLPPVCSLSDGIRALELALGAHQSAATGQQFRLVNVLAS
jgi:predicted dehydrogenase